jgi:hypothetical protein
MLVVDADAQFAMPSKEVNATVEMVADSLTREEVTEPNVTGETVVIMEEETDHPVESLLKFATSSKRASAPLVMLADSLTKSKPVKLNHYVNISVIDLQFRS